MTRDEEVWLRAWEASMISPASLKDGSCNKAADECLRAFRERFPERRAKNEQFQGG